MNITKEEKQKYADMYFNGINRKELREFKATTPKGHIIHGYICMKHNRHLGSLLILKVDGKDTEQFVQSFPKIKYYEQPRQINNKCDVHYAYEKLDGSCLIIYPLHIPTEDSTTYDIEYVPKTRGMPVADKHFLELFNRMDHTKIHDYYNTMGNKDDVLVFELYGNDNLHEIVYPDVTLDLTLIGVCKTHNRILEGSARVDDTDNPIEYVWLAGDELRAVSKEYFTENIPLIQINKQNNGFSLHIVPDSLLDDLNYTDTIFGDNLFGTMQDCIVACKKAIDNINENREAILLEGVVFNTIDAKNVQKYIKVKTSTIEIKHRSENGIPRADIIKELNKYFDDYQSQIKELYTNDKHCYWPYVREMLLEDYPVEYVDNHKTQKKTERLFLKMWDARSPSPELDTITDKLINDYPGYSVVDLIRLFAQKYPQLKKQANTVYSLLEVKLNQKVVK